MRTPTAVPQTFCNYLAERRVLRNYALFIIFKRVGYKLIRTDTQFICEEKLAFNGASICQKSQWVELLRKQKETQKQKIKDRVDQIKLAQSFCSSWINTRGSKVMSPHNARHQNDHTRALLLQGSSYCKNGCWCKKVFVVCNLLL